MKKVVATMAMVAVLAGCSLFEPLPKEGDTVIDPTTGEAREMTLAEVIAAYEQRIAKLDADILAAQQATQASQPFGPLGIAGTAVGSFFALTATRKKAQLVAEKQRLVAELQKRESGGTPTPLSSLEVTLT